MRTSDVDILIIPDRGGAPSDHWQARWGRRLKTAVVIEQAEWQAPRCADWVDRIVACARFPSNAAPGVSDDVSDGASPSNPRRPVVLVAHGLGVLAVLHAAERLAASGIAGAFLVAPPLIQLTSGGQSTSGAGGVSAGEFLPAPQAALPWPALVVASSTDPACPIDAARALATSWGADFTDAGAVGHLDVASGHGPWPDGLLRFGQFLRSLG